MTPSHENRSEQADFSDKALILGLKLASGRLADLLLRLGGLVLFPGGLVLALICTWLAWIQSIDIKTLFNDFAPYVIVPACFFGAVAWFSNLLSRVLWCAVRQPITAKLLAVVSSIGRMAVLFAVFYGWNSGRSFSDILLLPMTIACAAIAWLGLASDWLFVRTLHHHLVPSQTEHSLSEHTNLDTNAPLNDSNQRTFLSGTTEENVPNFFFVIIVAVVMQLVVAPLSFGGLVVMLPLILQVLPLQLWPQVKKVLVNEIIRSMTHDSKGSDQPPAEQV
jgi:hypothetical protein